MVGEGEGRHLADKPTASHPHPPTHSFGFTCFEDEVQNRGFQKKQRHQQTKQRKRRKKNKGGNTFLSRSELYFIYASIKFHSIVTRPPTLFSNSAASYRRSAQRLYTLYLPCHVTSATSAPPLLRHVTRHLSPACGAHPPCGGSPGTG